MAALIARGQRVGWKAAWVWGALLALGVIVNARHVDAPPLLVLLVLVFAYGVMHRLTAARSGQAVSAPSLSTRTRG